MSEEKNMNELNDGRDRHALAEPGRNLPSTDVYDSAPPWSEDEVNLRDYLDILIRRKWLVLSFLALVFITTLVFTLSMPKIYKAEATIEVNHETPNVTKFEEVVADEFKAREFYLTQVQLLASPGLAERVIDHLNLHEHPVVLETLFPEKEPGIMDRFKSTIRSLFSRENPKAPQPPAIDEGVLKQERLLRFMQANFQAEPDRQSFIIKVSFTSRDRHLSRQAVNAYIDKFIEAQMEKKLEASEYARTFLMRQIDRAKIALEKAEEDMNRFAQQAGIVSLDSKMNSIYRQLEEINTALAQTETRLIAAEAVYDQAQVEGPENLPQVLNNSVIGQLKEELTKLKSDYENLSVTFHDEYPTVKAIKSRINSLEAQLETEENRVFRAIKNEYQTALKQFEVLEERAEFQKRLAMDLNERATQYKIMEREVETNKGIYQSLLERAKEIESMVGVSASNIQVVDRARLPIFPFKPKVSRNLLLAIVLGLMGGIGLAFLLEHFTDTILNPDEITDRFRIPVLGVLPFTKADGEFPLEKILLHNPRAPLSEALRTTRVSIQLSGADKNARSFVISSTQPMEGKTLIAVNLAYTFAGAGERVALLDADLRKPRIHKIFADQESDSPGLSRFLAGVVDMPKLYPAADQKRLFILPAGPVPPNPVELLASHRFKRLIEVLHKYFDRIIIDGPPHHGFADILVLSRNVGGVVLVSSLGETTRSNLRHFKKSILNVQGNLLGCIINKVNMTKRYGYRSYYRYYQAYNYYSYGDTPEGKISMKKKKRHHSGSKHESRHHSGSEVVQKLNDNEEPGNSRKTSGRSAS
ncbi:MAG: polysaccharide biosynthesis tyrosine autokinase [Desulfatiglandaceae bacterium]